MQTFLIVSSNKTFIENEINKFRKKLNITLYTYHEITPNPSIGIEQVRQLKQIFILKPFGAKERLVVVREMEKATVPAQNALLKILEEPPGGTYLILTVGSIQQLLPTVISRCQLIKDKKSFVADPSETIKTQPLIKKIISASLGERIVLAQQLAKTREDALVNLDLLISFLRQLIYHKNKEIKLSAYEITTCLRKTLAAKTYVEKNINYKATLDILFIGFPKV